MESQPSRSFAETAIFLRDRRSHGGDDLPDAPRMFQQRCAAVMPVYGRGRAAEVDVDSGRAGLAGYDCRRCHASGVAAEELHLHRQARRRARPCGSSGIWRKKTRRGGTSLLTRKNSETAKRKGAGLALQRAHRRVGYSIHRSQNQRRDVRVQHDVLSFQTL